MAATIEPPRLVVHLVQQLDVGGLETGLINLIRHMPRERYRHTIVCLKDFSEYHAHIKERGVEIISLNKRAGTDLAHYMRMYRTLRALQPDLIHTRNLSGSKASWWRRWPASSSACTASTGATWPTCTASASSTSCCGACCVR
jgi:hypothetical protein